MRKKKKSQNVSERKAISFKSTVSLKTYFLQITYDLVFRKNHRQRERERDIANARQLLCNKTTFSP